MIAQAMAFLRAARLDPEIGAGLEAARDDVSWEALVRVGAGAGFEFSVEELARAFSLDWGMRWARYRPLAGGQ